MRRFVLLVLCAVAVGLWLGWPVVTNLLRRRLERELAKALGPEL